MKHIALIISILAISATASAQTYSNANLNGSYSLQFNSPQTYSWSKTFTCPNNSAVTYTVNVSQTGMEVGFGVLTFDGNGNVSVTFTQIGQENQTASANTTGVTWNSSCQVVKVNGGHVVYKASTTTTSTGTYSIQSNGTGTINPEGSSQQTLLLATTNNGVSATVLITDPAVNGKTIGTGIAVHQ